MWSPRTRNPERTCSAEGTKLISLCHRHIQSEGTLAIHLSHWTLPWPGKHWSNTTPISAAHMKPPRNQGICEEAWLSAGAPSDAFALQAALPSEYTCPNIGSVVGHGCIPCRLTPANTKCISKAKCIAAWIEMVTDKRSEPAWFCTLLIWTLLNWTLLNWTCLSWDFVKLDFVKLDFVKLYFAKLDFVKLDFGYTFADHALVPVGPC